ncbi:hypothetical protein ACF2G4_22885 (plasmid) [Pantoea sp. C3]|uniref:hypothetical protein n=1 Tax=Pantoea phytostimulans TaxID=2769024 RepID=UPI0038F6898E
MPHHITQGQKGHFLDNYRRRLSCSSVKTLNNLPITVSQRPTELTSSRYLVLSKNKNTYKIVKEHHIPFLITFLDAGRYCVSGRTQY